MTRSMEKVSTVWPGMWRRLQLKSWQMALWEPTSLPMLTSQAIRAVGATEKLHSGMHWIRSPWNIPEKNCGQFNKRFLVYLPISNLVYIDIMQKVQRSILKWPYMTGSNVRSYTRGRIIRLDELTSVVRRLIRTMKVSSSRRLMGLVPVFMLEMHNQTNKEFLRTDH